MNRTLIIGALAGMGVALPWAGWIVATRHGVQHTLTIYDIMGLRFGIAGLVILPWAIRSKLWRGLTPFRTTIVVAITGPPYVFSPGVWCIGFSLNFFGSSVQHLQMNS